MFGVGPQEVVVIVLLLVVVFGPGKAVGMARDLGRFANTAREQVDELKDEIPHGEEERNDLVSDPGSEDEYEPSLPEKGSLPEKRKAGSVEEPRS
jgi:Sec-independent protein translocase protein TatA